MTNESADPTTNEHVVELRYRPNAKILDHRGVWAEQISEHLELPHWQIIENRIDIFSKGQTEHAFVGFRNAGYTAADTPTKNFFTDKATKLFRFLFTLDNFGRELFVERLGLKSKFSTIYEGTFEELTARFADRYVKLSPEAATAIGSDAKLVDIGAPLNFVDKRGNFNTVAGPMSRQQLPTFFRKDEGFPEVALYYEIDYFIKPSRELSGKEIVSTITAFAHEAWSKNERIASLVVEG